MALKETKPSTIYIVKPIFCRQKNEKDWKREYQQKQYEYGLNKGQKWYETKQRDLGNSFLFGMGIERFFTSQKQALAFVQKEALLLSDSGYFNWVLIGEAVLDNPHSHLQYKWINLYRYCPKKKCFSNYNKSLTQSANYIFSRCQIGINGSY